MTGVQTCALPIWAEARQDIRPVGECRLEGDLGGEIVDDLDALDLVEPVGRGPLVGRVGAVDEGRYNLEKN